MEWYRAYHGMPYDSKLHVISKRSNQPMAHVVAIWLCVLDAASQHDPRGVCRLDPEEVSVMQDISLDAVENILKSFRDRGMITSEDIVASWSKRQRRTSTERSREARSKKQQDATDCNDKPQSAANETPREEQSRTDEEQTREDKKELEKIKKEEINQNKGEFERKKEILIQMLEVWNEKVQKKINPDKDAILTKKRRQLMLKRFEEDFKSDLDAWRYYCQKISDSDFYLGKTNAGDWSIDLTWAVKSSENVLKVLEGKEIRAKQSRKIPECKNADFKKSWKSVIRKLEQKYTSAVIENWFAETITDVEQDGVFKIICKSKFIESWIRDRFSNDLQEAFRRDSHLQNSINEIQIITQGENS